MGSPTQGLAPRDILPQSRSAYLEVSHISGGFFLLCHCVK